MSVEYNGTIATGGDSLHDDLNIYYNVSHINKYFNKKI